MTKLKTLKDLKFDNINEWECKRCGVFNIEGGVIKNGKMYCDECWEKIKKNYTELKTKDGDGK